MSPQIQADGLDNTAPIQAAASSSAGAARAAASRIVSSVPQNMNSVRGLACLLVVALHVVGDTDSNGLHLPMTSGWHYMMSSIEFLRMPLFTALSGYLYAGRRATSDGLAGFWQKKVRRLGAPLIFVTLIMWWLHRLADGDQPSLVVALLFQYGHLWYLQSLLILFAAISVADAFFRPSTVALTLAGLAALMVDRSGIPVTTFFGIASTFYLAPYFLFGIILREHGDWLRDPRIGNLALGVIVIVLISQQAGMIGVASPISVLQVPAAFAGMAFTVFLLQRFPTSAFLARIGHYSYTIYLWHILAGSASRTLLLKLGMTTVPALFLFNLAGAVLAPIALYHIARFIPLLSIAVTGERALRNPVAQLGVQARRTTLQA